jgi:hypothetical protein
MERHNLNCHLNYDCMYTFLIKGVAIYFLNTINFTKWFPSPIKPVHCLSQSGSNAIHIISIRESLILHIVVGHIHNTVAIICMKKRNKIILCIELPFLNKPHLQWSIAQLLYFVTDGVYLMNLSLNSVWRKCDRNVYSMQQLCIWKENIDFYF